MAQNSSTSSGGIGFFGLLTIVFIVLKLTNVIAWSWWWVLAPLWGPTALVLAVITIWFFFELVKIFWPRKKPKFTKPTWKN